MTTLYAKNDLAFTVDIRMVAETGRLVPLDDAVAPTAFLATSNASTATSADAAFVATPTPTGRPGQWLVQFDAVVLTPAAIAAAFPAMTTAWCIIQFAEGVRAAIELTLSDSNVVAPT